MNDFTKYKNVNRGYMQLDVGEKAIQLLRIINELLQGKAISCKIRSQILDSAQSVSANIAEGYCRRHLNEYIQFCYIALASLGETLTRSIGLKEIAVLTPEEFERIDKLHYEVENKLLALTKALEKKRADKNWNDQIKEEISNYDTQDNPDNRNDRTT